MTENNIVRILWLSDIHFREAYDEVGLENERQAKLNPKDKEDVDINAINQAYDFKKTFLPSLDKYLSGFHNLLNEYFDQIKSQELKLDYILVTGDLAFSGAKGDYELFEKKIIDPLRVRIREDGIKVLAVPGNHDVFWNEASFFSNFWDILGKSGSGGKKTDLLNLRRDFLQKKEEYFELIFRNYIDYFRKYNLSTLSSIEICDNYKDHGLFGIVVDREKRLVFNLLNSAWFALGLKFDEILLGALEKDFKVLYRKASDSGNPMAEENTLKGLNTMAKKLILAKTLSYEYGEQVLGNAIIDEATYLSKIDNHPGFCILTTFHHPPNWLQYTAKYELNNVGNDKLFFNQVMNRSQFLLTGHEHVPSSVKPEKISPDVYHIKGGMFMQDDMLTSNEGQHRFSILEIDTSRFNFSELKFSYDWKDEKWIKDETNNNRRLAFRRLNPLLRKEKEGEFIKKLQKKEVITRLLKNYFYWKDDLKRTDEVKEEFIEEFNVKLFYLTKDSKAIKVIVVPLDDSFFSKVLLREIVDPDDEHVFDMILRKAGEIENDLSITILAADFLIDEDLTARFYQPDEYSPHETHHVAARKADFVFNKSRHNFFNRFEKQALENSKRKHLVANEIAFSTVQNVRFSNQVIPFWILEKYN